MIFTPLAERHIGKLHEYIATHSSDERADGLIVEFREGLGTFPPQGRRRDGILQGSRVIGFERRINVAFIVTADTILIEGHYCPVNS